MAPSRVLRLLRLAGRSCSFKPHAPEYVEEVLAGIRKGLVVKKVDLRRFGLGRGVHIEPKPEEVGRLGRFLIVLYTEPGDMPDRDGEIEGGEVEPEDALGFRWGYSVTERGDPTPFWAAEKDFGNVRLSWSAAAKGADERLVRLDQLLSQLRTDVGG